MSKTVEATPLISLTPKSLRRLTVVAATCSVATVVVLGCFVAVRAATCDALGLSWDEVRLRGVALSRTQGVRVTFDVTRRGCEFSTAYWRLWGAPRVETEM